MNRWLCALLLTTGFVAPLNAADNTPPAGFEALFNGKDFTGFHGVGTEDPRKVQALSPEDRAKKFADSLADLNAHWKVDNGGTGI